MKQTENRKKRSQSNLKRNTSQLSSVQITFAVILTLGLILAINFSSRITAGQPLFEAYGNIKTEIAELQAESATLEAELIFVKSDTYVERWARDRGKMVRSGEKLVIPVPAGAIAVQPTPIPISTAQFDSGIPRPEPWEFWWVLFFDSPPPQNN